MNVSEYSDLVRGIRLELGYARGVPPKITRAIELEENRLLIVVPDRADKSLFIGPGGRVAGEIAKKTGRDVEIIGEDEILLKNHRLDLTRDRINEIIDDVSEDQKSFLDFVQGLLTREKSQLEGYNLEPIRSDVSAKVALAYSGGVDSGAALILLKNNVTKLHALTAFQGIEFIYPKEKNRILEICKRLEVKHSFIEIKDKISDIVKRTRQGNIHPCGPCHKITMESILEKAQTINCGILVTGELMPSGRQSIENHGDVLIIHLPAALALTKYRTSRICERHNIQPEREKFGCHLVGKTHSKGWKFRGPSIFRVLRELQAGVLTTGKALKLLKGILSDCIAAEDSTRDD